MEIVEVEVTPRQERGNNASRRLRRSGQIPAVVYGPGLKAHAVCVGAKQFLSRVRAAHGLHLVRLKALDPELADKIVLLKEVQVNPASNAVMHADFYQLDLSKQTRVRVPLHYTGKAEGVILGGILQPIEREIEIECLPMDIPESIAVDVTHMKVGDTLRISDVLMPPGLTAHTDSHTPIVIVAAPAVEEAKPAIAAEAAEAPAAEQKKEGEGKEESGKPS
jgi:large subunit ribosomal protein L25